MTTTRLWIGCVLTAALSAKVLAGSMNAPLNIQLYDRAHVGSKTLAQAERVSGEIFARAGIELHWTTRSVFDEDELMADFSAGGRTERLGSATVTAAIFPRAPQGFSPQALGFALPWAKRGIQVTIYADRVEMASSSSLASFYRVLGHALAHELGHVILRSTAHESSGLMKGVWSKSDWQLAAVGLVPFNLDQAKNMTQALLRIGSETVALSHSSTYPPVPKN
jgi:hypothetical protein